MDEDPSFICLFSRSQPEELSHRAHAQDDVQVVPDPLDQIAEHGVWSLQHVVLLSRVCQSVADLQEGQTRVRRLANAHPQMCEGAILGAGDSTNLHELVWLVEVGHLSGAQHVVDVLQEGLVHNLSVVEQKHRGLVVHACQTIQLLDVCGQHRGQ